MHMVTSREVGQYKTHSDQSQQTENPNSGLDESTSTKKESSLPSSPDKEVGKLPQRQNPNSETPVSQSNQEGALQLRPSPDGRVRSSGSNEEGSTLSIIPANLSDNLEEKSALENMNQEKLIVSIRPEKGLDKLPPRRNPEVVSHVLQSNQEPKPATIIPDKPSEDGYNWRKYGQKFVRGNEFIRSYYKCTFPNCPAKKQVERSHDGHITDIKYLRKHEHPKPIRSPPIAASFVLPIQVRKPDSTSFAGSEDESTIVPIEPTESPQPSIIIARDVVEADASKSNRTRDEFDDDNDLDLKRQKRDVSSANDTPMSKINGDPRIVVQTMSEVDIVNDGYRWRKYGQKLVKGNPNPRSYYRCSSAGCPVKKHVERASHDPKVVLTTYEGQHDHDMPAGRTVTLNNNTGGPNNNNDNNSSSPTNEDSRSEPTDEKEAVGLVPVSAN